MKKLEDTGLLRLLLVGWKVALNTAVLHVGIDRYPIRVSGNCQLAV